MQYLLLSNSTMSGQAYFEWSKKHIRSFLETPGKTLIFVPFAGVTISFDEYYELVKGAFESLGYSVESIHLSDDKKKAIESAEGIIVGGGNTFQLLNLLYANDLIGSIREKVKNGSPYIGWSAGSNIAGPTIKTTNDMPIAEPPSFDALNFVPYQINPHYTEKTIEGHGGESRLQRLQEFLEVNRGSKVVCLPEGMFIESKENQIMIGGEGITKILEWNKKPVEVSAGDNLNQFLEL